MPELVLEPVVITDMRIVAKASIVVYHNPTTNEFFIDPLLPENPLFKLGNFQGLPGEVGAPGAPGTPVGLGFRSFGPA